MRLTYVTRNDYKFEVAKKSLSVFNIFLTQRKIDTPEIQDEEVVKVASFSAEWASNILDRAVILTDAGFYINTLNGFPGPFIKYINRYLSADDLLQLMQNRGDRKVVVKECLAYATLGCKPITFVSEFNGTIATKKGKPGVTPISEIFIPEGYGRPESEIPHKEIVDFWGKSKNWAQLGKFLERRLL